MKPTQKETKLEEWLGADEMHDATKVWQSELEFVKDEYSFFDDLIKSYTLQLIDSKYFSEIQKIIDELVEIKKRTNKLLSDIKNHENRLDILVDGIDQPQEEYQYKKNHRDLRLLISDFEKTHKAFKIKLFKLIKTVIKEGKQKRLLE